MRISTRFTLVTLSCLNLALASCGGGGGGSGDNFPGAANVSIQIEPGEIDTGDRALAIADVSDVRENMILKFRFPTVLSYVPATATIEIDGREKDITPNINTTDAANYGYLVFFLGTRDFGDSKEGKIRFQLQANDSSKEGKIEIDADVDDPLIDNLAEFTIANPEFAAEDDVTINVIGQ